MYMKSFPCKIYNISTHQHTRANTIEMMMMTISAPVDDTPIIIIIVPKTIA